LLKIIAILLLLSSLYAEEEYQLGEGMQVASLPLFVGGYFSSDYRNMNNENRYTFDDLAVMGYGNYEKFSYMAEFEYKSFYVETHTSDTSNITRDTKIHTERIYLDYKLDENYMFRMGKYNNPIGFWNLLPVNVLRDTTSSPMSTNILFPKFTTGAAASYSSYNGAETKIDLMLQNNNDLDANYNNYTVDRHYGFNLSYEKDDYTIKLNGGYFRNIMSYSPAEPNEPDEIHEPLIHPEDLYYFLLSGKYDTQKYQFLSEIGTQRKKDEHTTNYAGYIQGLYRFTEQHVGIVRLESYDDKLHNKNDDMAIVGYTYRPIYPVAIKSEYQFHSLSVENQFLFSLSMMF
jgi:hypothetical protein